MWTTGTGRLPREKTVQAPAKIDPHRREEVALLLREGSAAGVEMFLRGLTQGEQVEVLEMKGVAELLASLGGDSASLRGVAGKVLSLKEDYEGQVRSLIERETDPRTVLALCKAYASAWPRRASALILPLRVHASLKDELHSIVQSETSRSKRVVLRELRRKGALLSLIQADIALEEADCIVNAANSQLAHGSGVAQALCATGGPAIQQESTAYIQQNGAVPVGSACHTGGGTLKCRHVIHAVGPAFRSEGTEAALLRSSVTEALRVAEELQANSIALPALSTGKFRFPPAYCAFVMLEALA